MTLLDNLVAYYKLDEASGNGLDAHTGGKTLTDTNTVGATTGVLNNGRTFDGTNERLVRSDTAFRFASGDFTVSLWANADSLAGSSYGTGLVSHMSGDAQGDWWITFGTSGNIGFGFWPSAGSPSGGFRQTANSVVTTATWYHIVVRKSGSTFTIWKDGASQSITVNGNTDSGWNNDGFQIGTHYSSDGNYFFDGIIDELGVWNVALSDAQIAELYNSGSPLPFASFGGVSGSILPIVMQMAS